MKTTKILMDMPITVEIADSRVTYAVITSVFSYFTYIDNTFSTFKPDSEMSRINRGELPETEWSHDMREIFKLCDNTKHETDGYFDIRRGNTYDPSGLVKGWAIRNAANSIHNQGFYNYYVDAGGDIQAYGKNSRGGDWTVGIRNPFNRNQIVKVITPKNMGVATSGTYIRGQHIYNPRVPVMKLTEIVSLTVIGPDVYEADRFATAAFAMQKQGIEFLERLPGFEGYMIDKTGIATYTSGFTNFIHKQ